MQQWARLERVIVRRSRIPDTGTHSRSSVENSNVIFGFGRRRGDDDDDDDAEEFVLFQGALNEQNPDLSENPRLVQAGLVPAKRLVTDALAMRADMIRLEPKGKAATSTIFVDGVPTAPTRMPPQVGLAMTQILKLLAGLNIKQRDKPQAGGIHAEYDGTPYEIRVNIQPVQGGGERLIVRIQNLKQKLETPEQLGISESLAERIGTIGSQREGVMLAVGPPFSGVTTVSVAMIRCVDAYLYSIFCIADLMGRELSHVTMFEANPGDTLEATLARVRRADADVTLVDPIKSSETAQTVLKASDQMVIVAESPAKDAADAIMRLVQMTGDPELVTGHLKIVVSQKLIRILCKKCRQAYRPNPKLLAKVGLPPETNVLYRAYKADEDDDEESCEACSGTGFRGRAGLLEAIELTEAIQKLVKSGADVKEIRKQARAEKMQTFQSDGLRLVADGKTSLEELQRVFRT